MTKPMPAPDGSPSLLPPEHMDRQAAWNDFLRDYLGCVDDDPGDARARYLRLIAEIERREQL